MAAVIATLPLVLLLIACVCGSFGSSVAQEVGEAGKGQVHDRWFVHYAPISLETGAARSIAPVAHVSRDKSGLTTLSVLLVVGRAGRRSPAYVLGKFEGTPTPRDADDLALYRYCRSDIDIELVSGEESELRLTPVWLELSEGTSGKSVSYTLYVTFPPIRVGAGKARRSYVRISVPTRTILLALPTADDVALADRTGEPAPRPAGYEHRGQEAQAWSRIRFGTPEPGSVAGEDELDWD